MELGRQKFQACVLDLPSKVGSISAKFCPTAPRTPLVQNHCTTSFVFVLPIYYSTVFIDIYFLFMLSTVLRTMTFGRFSRVGSSGPAVITSDSSFRKLIVIASLLVVFAYGSNHAQ